MPTDSSSTPAARHIALCYIRQSRTLRPDDLASAERQRDNIQVVCDANGWTPEWYVDSEGHKPGTNEDKRPAWLALKSRLDDLGVVALVANDLARLHRKAWHVTQTLALLDERDIRLVLAAPGREIDTSTPMGRAVINIMALHDEAYAQDVSERAKDSVQHRKRKGVTVGMPPFGTKRDANGYLVPSDEGAWWMLDGRRIAGKIGDPSPESGAVWRGYYKCAERILKLFAASVVGRDYIASSLTESGWSFRDRNGNPTPIEEHDVRRVTKNWIEYGGAVVSISAKYRRSANFDFSAIQLDPQRAVFDVKLLYQVGVMNHERSQYAPNRGHSKKASVHSLASLVYCAHCERLALQEGLPPLRSRLIAKPDRYQHQPYKSCGCVGHSISRADCIEQLRDMLRTVVLHPEKLTLLNQTPDEETEGEDAFIEAVQVAICADALSRITERWELVDEDERYGTLRQLIEAIIVDLDGQAIVEVRLRTWAQAFLNMPKLQFSST